MPGRKLEGGSGNHIGGESAAEPEVGRGQFCPEQNDVGIDPPAAQAVQQGETKEGRVNRKSPLLGEVAQHTLPRHDLSRVLKGDPIGKIELRLEREQLDAVAAIEEASQAKQRIDSDRLAMPEGPQRLRSRCRAFRL